MAVIGRFCCWRLGQRCNRSSWLHASDDGISKVLIPELDCSNRREHCARTYSDTTLRSNGNSNQYRDCYMRCELYALTPSYLATQDAALSLGYIKACCCRSDKCYSDSWFAISPSRLTLGR